MKILSKVKSYDVQIVSDVFDRKNNLKALAQQGRLFYFIDSVFGRHYAGALKGFIADDFVLTIEARENNKSYLKLAAYFKALIQSGFRKNDVLVTFGGGIAQDISGFIASTLYRGIKWAFIPTTLLAQADSCIGSKTSINFEDSKNLIGTFYPPDLILIDTALTKTLTAGDFTSGVGEIIKFHLLSDDQGYSRLKDFLASGPSPQNPKLNAIIDSTLNIKKSYFEQDEFDTGIRNLLNYGHCFGHALESVSDFSVPHGIAVIVGMGFANRIALARGLIDQAFVGELENILRPFYPPINFDEVTAEKIIVYMKKDKKRTGIGLTMILLTSIGKALKAEDVSEDEIAQVFVQWKKN